MDFPLCLRNAHEDLNILDWDPAGEDFHAVFEIRFKDYVAHAIDEGCGGGVKDIKALPKGA